MARAFEELIGPHLDGLYSAALCFTLDEHRAEELLQEASIKAFHEFAGHDPDVDFQQSMLKVLVSTYLLRQKRKGANPLASEAAPVTELFSHNVEPYAEPFPEPGTPGYKLLRAWLNQAWPQLDDGDRLVLWLADVEGLRHSQVAQMIDAGMEEVRSRHYRARRILSRGAALRLKKRAEGTEA